MSEETTKKHKKNVVVKKAISLETFVFLAIFFSIFGLMARKMGTPLMFKTMMATAHDLLLNTVFFIMAMAVIAGAMSALLSEFGAIALINKIFAPLMKPLWGMPGASVTGALDEAKDNFNKIRKARLELDKNKEKLVKATAVKVELEKDLSTLNAELVLISKQLAEDTKELERIQRQYKLENFKWAV